MHSSAPLDDDAPLSLRVIHSETILVPRLEMVTCVLLSGSPRPGRALRLPSGVPCGALSVTPSASGIVLALPDCAATRNLKPGDLIVNA